MKNTCLKGLLRELTEEIIPIKSSDGSDTEQVIGGYLFVVVVL